MVEPSPTSKTMNIPSPANADTDCPCGGQKLQAALIAIQTVAEKARSQHSVRGHQCELRAALDSICDRAAKAVAQPKRRQKPNVATEVDYPHNDMDEGLRSSASAISTDSL
jgi:hypothetical protein